jgi:6-pyruvoyltetrahydropterin/6-carboxytetrahydropterin synthase
MVMDFGFIKTVMMEQIHDPCDHGLILWYRDPVIQVMTDSGEHQSVVGPYDGEPIPWLKLYKLDAVPTAENLAKHWFDRVKAGITQWKMGVPPSASEIKLDAMHVWETPNSLAVYRP